MPMVPMMTNEPTKRNRPALIFWPKIVNEPCSHKLGMARSASLAKTLVAAISKRGMAQTRNLSAFIDAPCSLIRRVSLYCPCFVGPFVVVKVFTMFSPDTCRRCFRLLIHVEVRGRSGAGIPREHVRLRPGRG